MMQHTIFIRDTYVVIMDAWRAYNVSVNQRFSPIISDSFHGVNVRSEWWPMVDLVLHLLCKYKTEQHFNVFVRGVHHDSEGRLKFDLALPWNQTDAYVQGILDLATAWCGSKAT